MSMTVKQALARAKELEGASDTPRLDAEVLLGHALERDRTYLYTWPESSLTDEQAAIFEEYLVQRCAGCPVAYIVGYKEFWSLRLEVNRATLIPRPETELLVQQALGLLAADESALVADLGTGTGAIALAIASERPGWQVHGFDRSADIIELAEKNRRHLDIHNARFTLSDWCSQMSEHAYDMIVANPPYVAPGDPHLDKGGVSFEPVSALVAGDSGLGDIRIIARQAKTHLKSGGLLILEHGYNQAEAVAGLLLETGYEKIETRQDLSGLDRITQCQWVTDSNR